MERALIVNQVCAAISDTLNVDVSTLSEATAAGELHEWDSLGHLMVMSEVERRFRTNFSMEEILGTRTVADVVALLQRREFAT